jgi:hypothetical protein
MNHDDPIALLRALDPLDEKQVEEVVGRLAEAGTTIRAVVQRRRRRRGTWLLMAAAAAAAVITALVANPLSREGAISSAQAQEQAARALDLTGNWHVTSITQSGTARGSGRPRLSKPSSNDVWHAADGRMLIKAVTVTSDPSASTTITQFADLERRVYDAGSNTLTEHRFLLAADKRDDEQTYLPPTAADLYRAAYRVGKVRLAGIETLNGRRVFRLVFDWLGASYTLIFDAERRIPIAGESRSRMGNGRVYVTRVRYTTYTRAQPGPDLDRGLALPRLPNDVKTIHDPVLMIPQPVQGGSASYLATQIAARYHGTFGADMLPSRAKYIVVRDLPGGGLAAVARVPVHGNPQLGNCLAIVEIAHPGGETFVLQAGCASAGSMFAARSRNGNAVLVGGTTKSRQVTIKLGNGKTVPADVEGHLYFAAVPVDLLQYRLGIVMANSDGTNTYSTSWLPLWGIGGFPGAFMP